MTDQPARRPPTIYPWQTAERDMILTAYRQDRMPHAILLTGMMGIGLTRFSEFLSVCLLCENLQNATQFCGHCRSCQLMQAGSHPDWLVLQPEENANQINVADVREMIDFMHLKSQYGRYKISMITHADAINRSAANALLKTLEEPPGQSLFILLSHTPHRLPITIRSRCQRIKFSPAYDDATVRWVSSTSQVTDGDAQKLLALAGGAPLRIRALLEEGSVNCRRAVLDDLAASRMARCDVVDIAGRWKNYDSVQVLSHLMCLCADLIRIKLSMQALRNDETMVVRLHQWAKQLELRELSGFYQLLLARYESALSVINYRTEGLLEDVVIAWQRLGGANANTPDQQKR